MKTAVSVIIPYYYGSEYIPQLLRMMDISAEHLLAASGDEIEVLFVNDSPEEKISIDGNHPYEWRIITNQKNCGIHASRVNGLNKAVGRYILFLDQDDRITDNCFVSQISRIGDADLIVGNGYEEKQNGKKNLIFQTDSQLRCSVKLNCHYYYNNLIRSPGQVLVKKSSIPKYWTENILNHNGSDDAFLWLLMLGNGCTAVVNNDIVYEHAFTGKNASGNDALMLQSQKEVADKLKGVGSPLGIRAFQRRAEYYCTAGPLHRLRFLDVGISRFFYARVFFRTQRKETARCKKD